MAVNNKDIGDLLRRFGYSIPASEEEVIAFEKKYSKDYELPNEWSSIDEIISKDYSDEKKVIALNDYDANKSIIPLSMAAREGKEITKAIREKMIKDKNEAKK